MVSIFGLLMRYSRWNEDDNDTAIICVIRNVSCPYCGGTYPIITLGALRPFIEKRMVRDYGMRAPNPMFKKTHLSNPIECPICNKKYVVFVGVAYDRDYRHIKDIHVKVARMEDQIVKDNMRWPHEGLVMKNVIEYNPPDEVLVFESIEHYAEYNGDLNHTKPRNISNLIEMASPSHDPRDEVKTGPKQPEVYRIKEETGRFRPHWIKLSI